MSNTLQAMRADLEAVLGGIGVTVHQHLPERLAPPMAMLAAGSPYLESGQAFGALLVRYTIVLVAGQASNHDATAALDEVVARAAVAISNSDWGLERVDQPTMLRANNAEYYSTTIDVAQATHLEVEET